MTKQYLADSSDRFQSYIAMMKGMKRRGEHVHLHATENLSTVKQQQQQQRSIDDIAMKDDRPAGGFHDKYNMYEDSMHSSNSDEDSNVPYY